MERTVVTLSSANFITINLMVFLMIVALMLVARVLKGARGE